jgi:hypothetical protein
MKLLHFFSALLIFTCVLSCSKNNNDEATTSPNNQINGRWSLRTISTSIAGSNYTFPSGQIKWTFNSTNTTLTVVNNSNITDFNLPTGVYNYSIGQNNSNNGAPCSEYLTIDGGNYGCIAIVNGELSLSSSNPDGINYFLTSN